MHGSDWGVGGGGGVDIVLQTKNYGSMRVYFIVQIPPFIDWTCSACQAWVCSHGWDDMEFANRPSLCDAAATSES